MKPSTTDHALLRRYRAEDLVRLRSPAERQRYAASQRRGRVDPNPHQIDAVMFALRRIPDGGCILADEVGLGKTIEAGLVICQMLAEGANRIALILPRPLVGQWRSELYSLFGVETKEVDGPESLLGSGVFVMGREFAGGERGSSLLRTATAFDLVVIDEAHEIFAGIYKRYNSDGTYDESSKSARLAARVKASLGMTPVLLLTATPIQNSLTELWGLIQYVEPTGTLLGSLGTFRALFCEPGSADRSLIREQAEELRHRVNQVCQRTLRRQAAEFLERPFTARSAKLFEYQMTAAEQKLYDEVTQYLLEPRLCAFQGNSRRLLLISFHRLMASSLPAFAKGLDKVAARLEGMLDNKEVGSESLDAVKFGADIDEIANELPELQLVNDDAEDEMSDESPPDPPPEAIRAELDRVRDFAQRARRLRSDSKAKCLRQAIQFIRQRGEQGLGSGKAVIFTESLTTQEYLSKLLVESDLGLTEQDITLFRGANDSPRAKEALARWWEDVGDHLPQGNRPSPDVAVRLALVHEFQHRSHVFISTEAGAKGLNLQFCETIVNYDLPWNPQRIEQRIGRCHRYGQTQDVMVINFLSKNNEAQRLTFDILSQKLDLFGQVLDASDVVLHQPTTDAPESLASGIGNEFETQLRRIYDRARSTEDLSAELRQFADSLEEQRQRFEETQARMQGLIQSRLDESIRSTFRQIAEDLPGCLAELDAHLDEVVTSYLDAVGAPYTREPDPLQRVLLNVEQHDALPEDLQDGAQLVIGHSQGLEDHTPLHLGHPLVQASLAEARQACKQWTAARVLTTAAEGNGKGRSDDQQVESLKGRRGRLLLMRLRHTGFEPFEDIFPFVLLKGDVAPLDSSLARRLLELPFEPVEPPDRSVDELDVEDALEEIVFRTQAKISAGEQERFEQAMRQLERYVEDQLLVQKRKRLDLLDSQRKALNDRDAATGPEPRNKAERRLKTIEKNLDLVARRIEELSSRQEEEYLRWRQLAHERRYSTPTLERLAELELEIQ